MRAYRRHGAAQNLPGRWLIETQIRPDAGGSRWGMFHMAAAHIDVTRDSLPGLICTADAGGMPDGSFAAS
jgi:hypothetical protein